MAIDKSKSLIMAQRLRELRNEKGLSYEALRNALMEKYEIDISIDSLKNYEVSKVPHAKAYKNEGMRVEYLRCLTDFYGVSSDYLLGRTNDPAPKCSAVDDLGISPKAVEWIKLFVKNDDTCFDYEDTASIFNLLLEDVSFTAFFHDLCTYFHVKRAEYIYEALLGQAFPTDEDGSRVVPHEELVEFNRKVDDAIKNTVFPDDIPDNAKREDYLPYEIADYLQAILELKDNVPGDSDFIDAMTDLYEMQIGDIPELKARKTFDRMMRTLDRHAEEAGEIGKIPKCFTDAMRSYHSNN